MKTLADPSFGTPIRIFHLGLSEHIPDEMLEQINRKGYVVTQGKQGAR